MAQYIERAKVTDALIDNTSIVGSQLEEAVNAICAIPAADVRPVVTCCECKHWETNWIPQGVSDGRHYCAPLDLFPSADWYCSDGVKREEVDE